MSRVLRIKGGRLFDPAHGVEDELRDVVIADGRVVDSVDPGLASEAIDATNCIVMPGGVEMHAHIASTTVNTARMIQSAAGYPPVVPTSAQTGADYAKLGYTTAIEPAVPPEGSRAAHWQLDHLPLLDTGILTLLGNHEGIVRHLAAGDNSAAGAMLRSMLARTGAFGIKAVNPAGVSAWRMDPEKTRIDSIDDCIAGTQVSPRSMLEWLTDAQEELGLAHPTHIHGPQLGEAGNIDITRLMLKALEGRRFHLAHLQYYAYGTTKQGGIQSGVEPLLEALGTQPHATFDLGLVSFGPAFTATSDLPLEHGLYNHAGAVTRPASFFESGNEDCFGVMPLMHKPDNPIHALQWAIGLELALLADNPWQFALTVDHPNGGSFTHYPELIALLMDPSLRAKHLQAVHAAATNRTSLASIKRAYTLNEIAVITRAAPAKALGLKQKGHLGVGADGDVTLYDASLYESNQFEAMFAKPHMTIKAGKVIVRESKLEYVTMGNRLRASIACDSDADRTVADWLNEFGTVAPSQYGLDSRELSRMQAVAV